MRSLGSDCTPTIPDVLRAARAFQWLVLLLAGSIAIGLSGCGNASGEGASESKPNAVILGLASNTDSPAVDPPSIPITTPQAADVTSGTPTNEPSATEPTPGDPAQSGDESKTTPPSEARSFRVEGPENALRVSYDDFDLLKVMNLDPVPPDAPERLPKWLKDLDGKRIRIRGFMYPPFQDKDIRGFVLARDNQICCFGRTPKEYDLVDVFMRPGVTTHYIQNRPFDVVGVFKIKSEIEKFTAMYELEDAVVIEK